MSIRTFNITVNGTQYEVEVEETTSGAPAAAAVSAPAVSAPAAAPKAAPAAAPKAAAKPAASGANFTGAVKISAPFPGTVVSVAASAGKQVKKGEVLCVIEAMKMENEISAPQDGTVASINVQKGASVQTGDLLISMN